MKNLNSYKKIAKELIKEAAWDRKFGEPLPTLSSVMKKTKNEGAYDDDADKQGRDDGDSWMANSSAGDYGAKHKGKIRYFDDEDSAKAYAKSGSEDSQAADDSGDKSKGKPTDGDDEKDSGGKLSGGDFKREGLEESIKPKIHPFKKTYKKIGGK